jgi:hypothetical protein
VTDTVIDVVSISSRLSFVAVVRVFDNANAGIVVSGRREAGGGSRLSARPRENVRRRLRSQQLFAYFRFESALSSAENGWIASCSRIPAVNGPNRCAMLLA